VFTVVALHTDPSHGIVLPDSPHTRFSTREGANAHAARYTDVGLTAVVIPLSEYVVTTTD
jgi:hypothetical protein